MRIASRIASLALSAGILSGCTIVQHDAPPDALAIATRACLAQNKQFVDAWGCVQNKDLLDQIDADPQRRKQFMKLGDDLASQVAAKKLSNAAAVQRLEAGLSVGRRHDAPSHAA